MRFLIWLFYLILLLLCKLCRVFNLAYSSSIAYFSNYCLTLFRKFKKFIISNDEVILPPPPHFCQAKLQAFGIFFSLLSFQAEAWTKMSFFRRFFKKNKAKFKPYSTNFNIIWFAMPKFFEVIYKCVLFILIKPRLIIFNAFLFSNTL